MALSPDPALRIALAAEAGVATNTIDNYCAGYPMRSTTRAHVERALKARGLPLRAEPEPVAGPTGP